MQLLVLLVVGAALLVVALPWALHYQRPREALLALASGLSGYRIEASRIEFGSDWRLLLLDLEISRYDGETVLGAAEFELTLPPAGLLEGRAGLVRIDGFTLLATRGSAAASAGERNSGPWRLPFDELQARDGVLRVAGYEGLRIGIIEITARPDLVGQGLAASVNLSAEGGPLEQRLELAGSLLLDSGGDRAELDCQLSIAPGLAPASLHGTLFGVGSARLRVDIALDWPDVAVTEVAGALLADSALRLASGRLHLNARLRGEVASPRVSATLTLSDLALAWAGMDVAASTLVASATVEFGAAGPSLRLEGITIDGLDAHDQDFSRVVQGLSLAGRISVTSAEAGTEFSVSARSAAGELLWDSFYVDLAQLPSSFSLDGVAGPETLVIEQLSLELDGIGQLDGRAELGRGGKPRAASLGFDVDGLERAYQLFVAAPLQASHPALAGLALSGRVSGDLELSLAEAGALLLDGHISLGAERLVTAGGRLRIDGLEAELPVMIGLPLRGDGSGMIGATSGSVTVAGGSIAGLELAPFQLPLRVSRDRIEAAEDLLLELAGGSLRIGALGFYNLSESRRRLVLSLQAEGLDIAELLEAARLPVVEGSVAADFSQITVSSSAVESRGEVTVALFGGQIMVRDLSLEQLDTPVPALFLDVEARDIDLAQVTAATSLGEISGIASGAIEKLEIVAGEPVAFAAWVETVPVRGKSQRISVTALEQLQILGGGGNNPLTSGLLSFFDAYRYARMGLRCRLRNDRFVLEGVRSADGKDYLVVGSLLPPTVNVISHNQVIDFSQMLERLARIAEIGGKAVTTDEDSR